MHLGRKRDHARNLRRHSKTRRDLLAIEFGRPQLFSGLNRKVIEKTMVESAFLTVFFTVFRIRPCLRLLDRCSRNLVSFSNVGFSTKKIRATSA